MSALVNDVHLVYVVEVGCSGVLLANLGRVFDVACTDLPASSPPMRDSGKEIARNTRPAFPNARTSGASLTPPEPLLPSMSSALPAAAVLASAAVAAGLIIGPAYAATSADPVVTPPPTATPTPTPTPTPTTPPLSQWPSKVTVGYSNKGRKIVAKRTGSPTAQRVMLAIGIIHGNENKGKKIIKKVRKKNLSASSDVQIWTISSMNPDGTSANQRYNARGVDLNRNFPNGWSRGTRGAGTGPASEPETQSLMAFMNKLRPDGSLVFHQDWNMVLGVCNSKTAPYAIQFASLARIPREPCRRAFTGTMGSWANSALPGYLLTVELPGSRQVNGKKVKRWAKAVKKQSMRLPNLDPTSPLPQPPAPVPTPAPSPTVTLG